MLTKTGAREVITMFIFSLLGGFLSFGTAQAQSQGYIVGKKYIGFIQQAESKLNKETAQHWGNKADHASCKMEIRSTRLHLDETIDNAKYEHETIMSYNFFKELQSDGHVDIADVKIYEKEPDVTGIARQPLKISVTANTGANDGMARYVVRVAPQNPSDAFEPVEGKVYTAYPELAVLDLTLTQHQEIPKAEGIETKPGISVVLTCFRVGE